MTNDPWAVFFVVVGMLTIIRFMLPIYEAAWFALVTTVMVMLGSGWASLRPSCLIKLAGFFLRNVSSRLCGPAAYCVKQELDGWVFEPPFKIYRERKKQSAND